MYDFFEYSTDVLSNDPAVRLERRFINYLISFPFARSEFEGPDTKEDAKEAAIRKRKLEVERLRQQERDRKKKSMQRYQDRVSFELHETIYERIIAALNDGEEVKARTIPMPENLPLLIDTINTRAASLAAIEELSNKMTWLHEGVLRVVNNPPFSTRRKASEIKVESYRLAMGFVGTENLRTLVPAYALQNWLPYSTRPFSMFRRKIWDHSLATANLAFVLAERRGLKQPDMAYTLGMFHELGKIALMKLYLRIFDEVQQKAVIATVNDSNADKHNALRTLIPDEQFLRDLMLEQDKRATQIVVAGWDLKRVPLSQHLLSFVEAKDYDDLSDYAQILAQANAYSEFRMLKEIGMVEAEEAKHLFTRYKFDKTMLADLREVGLKNIRITVPES